MTKVVNNCVAKAADGTYQLVMDSPMLQEMKMRFETEYSKKGVVDMPRGLAEVQWGGEKALQRALDKGQAWEDSHPN